MQLCSFLRLMLETVQDIVRLSQAIAAYQQVSGSHSFYCSCSGQHDGHKCSLKVLRFHKSFEAKCVAQKVQCLLVLKLLKLLLKVSM